MSGEQFGAPFRGMTYQGFAGPQPVEPTPRRALSRQAIIGGAALALIAGGFLGAAGHAELQEHRPIPPASQPLAIEMAAVTPPPAVAASATKLDVLSPEATAQPASVPRPVAIDLPRRHIEPAPVQAEQDDDLLAPSREYEPAEEEVWDDEPTG